MLASSQQSTRVNILLICVTIVFALLAASCTAAPANDKYQKALSMAGQILLHKSDNNIDPNDPNLYATEDSLMTREGNPNMVSRTLRLVHQLSENNLYRRSKSLNGQERPDQFGYVEPHGEFSSGMEYDGLEHFGLRQSAYDTRTDDEVIMDVCKARPTKPCDFVVKKALKQNNLVKHKIALSLRNKPDSIDGPQLLYLKMFESTIGNVEAKNIDDKLEFAATSLLSMFPTTRAGLLVSKAMKPAMKPVFKRLFKRPAFHQGQIGSKFGPLPQMGLVSS